MKRVAILLLGHKNPDQINAFIGQILSTPGEHGVFVHIDRKSVGVVEKIITHPRVTVLTERVDIRWVDISQVEATLLLLRTAMADPAGYEVFTVKSGQDLAVRADWPEAFSGEPRSWFSARKIEAGDSLAAWHLCRWPRWTRQLYASKRHPGRILRRTLLLLAQNGILLFPNRHSLPQGWSVYHGTHWVTLCREHALTLLNTLENQPEILRFFSEALSPEERIFHTVLLNSPGAENVVLQKSHFEEFIGNHPRTLGVADLAQIDASGLPFARKFDAGFDSDVIETLLKRTV